MNQFIKLLFVLVLPVFAQATPIEVPAALETMHLAACPDIREEWKDMSSVDTLTGDTKIYVLSCSMAAYNTAERAYSVTPYGEGLLQIDVISLATYAPSIGFSASADLQGAGYDAATKTLSTFYKGRGLGDCGSSSVSKYVADSYTFVLVSVNAKEKCDGRATDWPQVYKNPRRLK